MADLDLSALIGGDKESTATAVMEVAKPESAGEEDYRPARTPTAEDVHEVLLPVLESEEPEETPKETKEQVEEEKASAKTSVVMHRPELLRYAESWGIGPDEAATYGSERDLLGAIALREVRYRRAVEARSPEIDSATEGKRKDAAPELPQIELDEETPPELRKNFEGLLQYAKGLKEWADARISTQAGEIEQLKNAQQQGQETARADEEVRIAQLFDERVGSWGDEFKELLGVPTQTWEKPGSPEHGELMKLHAKTRMLAAGYSQLTGRRPSLKELGQFMDEARLCLWPERIKNAVRRDITKAVRKQRSGVGLRPTKTVTEQAPVQGDEAAKAAISDYMVDQGVHPWAIRRAS